jgi:hypothetical protein
MQESLKSLGANTVMIRELESASPFARPLGVEAGQRGADQYEEEARCSAHCDLSLGAQFAFNFLLNPVLLPTTNRSIGTSQKPIFVSSAETCLALGGTSGLLEMSSQPSRGSAGSGCRAAILHFLW